jgi:uncharacterized protein DUF4149
MGFLRFLSLLVLAVWVGGLAVIGGLAAPEIFAALESQDPETGRALAGIVFGAVFTRFQHLAWILGGVLMALLGLRAVLGPRPLRLGIRMWTIALMLAMSLGTQLVISPRIDAIRTSVSGAVAALPDTDARKQTFGRLHAVSSALMLATLALGAGLIWVELRDSH